MGDADQAKKLTVDRGMRWKMMVAMVGMIVALVVLLTLLQVNAQRSSLKGALAMHSAFLDEQVNKRAARAADQMTGHIQNLIATQRLPLAKEFLQDVVRDIGNLRYVILMQGTRPRVAIGANLGDELQQYILSGSVSEFAAGQQQRMHHHFKIDGHAFMEMVVPIMIQQQQWGVLRLGFSLDELNALLNRSQAYIDGEIKQAVLNSSLTSLLFLLLGALAIYYFARRWTDPIQQLVHFSHQLAGGDFTATPHISTRTDDEIGLLVAALEEMADSLRHSYAQLEEHSHLLEETVEERTRELARARDKALAAAQAKSDFLANMSHEIRTPMNAVIGMAHLAMDGAEDGQQRDYLNKILTASETLLVIINDILDFSKVEAGKMQLEAMDFQLSDTLANLATISEVEAKAKGLEVLFDYPADLPVLHGDSMRLGQVLLNLVNNAVKFTAKGQVKVSVVVLEQSDAWVDLEFSVEDCGIGMTAAQQQQLFQAFTQADTSITRNYGGTGLGLAICKQLVELMQGTIGVESKPGEGSRFYFHIPFALGSSKANALPVVDKTLEPEAMLALHGARLLLVEDNEINRQVTEGLLARVGISLSIAHDGQQAVEAVFGDGFIDEFDGVLMDMQMPVMDGLEAARLIRADAQFADLPMIAMTANATDTDRDLCLEAGMNDYISKPIDPDQLYATLIRWIRISQVKAAEHLAPVNITNETEADVYDFDALSGLDVAAGLERVGGDAAVYRSILCKFHASQADSLKRIVDAEAAGDRPLAIQLAHALKGVAGNIAATELHAAVETLESQLHAGERLDETVLARASGLLDSLVASLNRWLQANPPSRMQAPMTDGQSVAIMIGRMREMLAEYNGDAVDLMDALAEALDGLGCEVEIRALRQHLSCYDFDAASADLAAIAARCVPGA